MSRPATELLRRAKLWPPAPPAPPIAPLRGWERSVLLLCLGVTGYLRWPNNPVPALWFDEAWRALAIVRSESLWDMPRIMSESYRVLLPGEYVLGRLALLLSWTPEMGLRLVPWLAMLAACWAGFLVLRYFTSTLHAALICLQIAVGYNFIVFSREFKNHAVDWAALMLVLAAVLYWVCHQAPEGSAPWWRRARPWAAAGVVMLAALLSITSAFVLPAVFAYLLFRRAATRAMWVAFPLAGALFVLLYVLLIIPQYGALSYQGGFYWNDQFVSNWTGWSDLGAALGSAQGFLPGTGALIAWACYVAALGLSLYRRDGFALIIGIPLLLAVLASAAQVYPLYGRPAFYLYGLLACCGPYVLFAAVDLARERGLTQPIAAHAVLLLLWLAAGVVQPKMFPLMARAMDYPADQANEILDELQLHTGQGDVVWTTTHGWTHLDLARRTGRYVNRDGVLLTGESPALRLISSSTPAICEVLQGNAARKLLQPGTRHWFVLTHVPGTAGRYWHMLASAGSVTPVVAIPRQTLLLFTPSADGELTCTDPQPGAATTNAPVRQPARSQQGAP